MYLIKRIERSDLTLNSLKFDKTVSHKEN